PHHRHQSSLEGIVYLSSEAPLEPGQRNQARRKFYDIISYFEATEPRSDEFSGHYNRPLLVRLTYEYSRSEKSQDIFLRAFFQSVALPIDGEDDVDLDDTELEAALVRFAEHLFDNFFLPRKI
ncbi:hypothetical protein B0H63DRAFT_384064, partial [Podospora didyma]